MDSDVYVQDTLEYVWKECDNKILLYDINHGLQVDDYQRFVKETHDFGLQGIVTHYGGEFFSANKEKNSSSVRNAKPFSNVCVKIIL